MRTFTRIAIALAATAGLVGATLSARASSAATAQWTTLKEAPAPVSNPMKGFMPWAHTAGDTPVLAQGTMPYTLEWAPFPVNTSSPDTTPTTSRRLTPSWTRSPLAVTRPSSVLPWIHPAKRPGCPNT